MRVLACIAVASSVALAACRGGVKSGLRAWERPEAPGPVASAPVAAVPAPREASSASRPQVWRIEYYKISDG